jgi:hypothetical protein
MKVRRGATRVILIGSRWAVKIPAADYSWGLRGWLANRSEWRQRRRTDVIRPIVSFAHLVVVFPAALEIGDDDEDRVGPWSSMAPSRYPDESRANSWGRFEDGWRLVDFDRCWDREDRGIVGGLYFARLERLARKWQLPAWWLPHEHPDAVLPPDARPAADGRPERENRPPMENRPPREAPSGETAPGAGPRPV